jgi:hypothetical protein
MGLVLASTERLVNQKSNPMRARHFPPPWTLDVATESFCIRDANGQALAYVYFEDEKTRRAAFKQLTRDEARRIAANIVKMPEVLSHTIGVKARKRANWAAEAGTTALAPHKPPRPAEQMRLRAPDGFED